jgi:hypothetical protein
MSHLGGTLRIVGGRSLTSLSKMTICKLSYRFCRSLPSNDQLHTRDTFTKQYRHRCSVAFSKFSSYTFIFTTGGVSSTLSRPALSLHPVGLPWAM